MMRSEYDVGCPVISFSTYFLKTESLAKPGARLAAYRPRNSPISNLQIAGDYMLPYSTLYVDAGDSNPGLST